MATIQIQSPSSFALSPKKQPIGPYGIQFGEESQIRKREQLKYKEDLDYLCNLRKKYGEMSQKEWEEYNRKLNYMNDVYNPSH